ncbi:hypothetical protein SESBI_47291 [Sesbania bispinosa]|nr:hypothetical protein SESBI_47291 [Sesbania bispinosa]
MKFEDKSETSSSHGGLSAAGAVPVPPMPKLQIMSVTQCSFVEAYKLPLWRHKMLYI